MKILMNKYNLAFLISLCCFFAQAKNKTALIPVLIPAGEFLMGCSAADELCDDDEGIQGGIKVNVPAFYMDLYEVTVDEYKQCVERGKCSPPKNFKRNKYCNYGEKSRGAHPVNCIDWVDAKNYCTSRRGRLPYEAEWEKAARAGANSRYPWGQDVSCKQAILDDGKTMGSVANEPDGCGEDRTWVVGSRAQNRYGLYDMLGNVGEWLENWYAKDSISQRYAKGDLTGPKTGKQKLARGGSWDESKQNLRSSFRNVKPPVSGNVVYGSIGFRCAYDGKKNETRDLSGNKKK